MEMSTVDKTRNGDYKSKLEWPDHLSKYNPDNDLELQNKVGTISELNAFKLAQKQRHDEAQKAMRDAYKEDESRLHLQFKSDIEEEFGVTENPKKDKVFSLAWDRGHSNGYTEVYYEYSELVDLIID